MVKHALRNAALPIITVIGQSIGTLLTGAIIIETVFNIPGIGQLVSNSILRRDYEVIQGVVLVSALIYVVINFLVDTSYGLLDPRVKEK
jgi:peptide/nickel transport system permease protein